MKIFLCCSAIALSVFALIILLTAFYCGKPIKRLFLNAVFGISVLCVINLTSKFSGVYIPVNVISVVGISVFSIPAVIGFLLLNLIFI